MRVNKVWKHPKYVPEPARETIIRKLGNLYCRDLVVFCCQAEVGCAGYWKNLAHQDCTGTWSILVPLVPLVPCPMSSSPWEEPNITGAVSKELQQQQPGHTITVLDPVRDTWTSWSMLNWYWNLLDVSSHISLFWILSMFFAIGIGNRMEIG